MQKDYEYKIVCEEGNQVNSIIKSVQQQVENLLNDNWQFCGMLNLLNIGEGNLIAFQTLVKDKSYDDHHKREMITRTPLSMIFADDDDKGAMN